MSSHAQETRPKESAPFDPPVKAPPTVTERVANYVNRVPKVPEGVTRPDGKTPTDTDYAQGYVDAVEEKRKAPFAKQTPHGNSTRTEKTPKVTFDGKLNVGGAKKTITTREVTEKTVLGDDRVVEKSSSKNRDASVAISGSGATGTVGWGNTNESGTTTRTGVTGGYDADKKQVTLGGSHNVTSSKGKNQGSIAAQATFGKDSISGQVTAGTGPVKITVKGGLKVVVSDPVLVGDQWVVTWQKTADKGGSLGLSAKGMGISGGSSQTEYEKGTRQFPKDKKDEALAFKEDPHPFIASTHMMPPPTSVMGAMFLAVGEERGAGSSTDVSASGSVTGSGLTVGAGMTEGETHDITVNRKSKNIFEVTVLDAENDDKNISGGGYGVTAKAGMKSNKYTSLTLRFDLHTPDGIQAYELFTKTRIIPMTGAKIVAFEKGDGEGKYDGLDTPIGSATFSGDTAEKTRWDETGKHEEYKGGRSDTVSPNTLGKWLGDKDSSKSYELLANQENDVVSSYLIRGTFSGDSGLSNRDGMYRLTGRDSPDRAVGEESKSSGSWMVTTEMAKDKVDTFMRLTMQGHYGGELKAALLAAENDDDKMRALTAFVARGGHKALENMWAREQTFDVELKGDKNFPGRAGRLEMEAKLKQYAEELSGPTTFTHIENDIEALSVRRQAVRDPKSYEDLPDELRAEEIGKINDLLGQLVGLRDRAAIESAKNRPGEKTGEMENRQKLEQEYDLLPQDPVQRQLYVLRDEIASAQATLGELELHNSAVREQLMAGRAGGDANTLRAIRDTVDGAARIETRAHGHDQSVREARLAFVRAIGLPQDQLGSGARLLAGLQAQIVIQREAERQYDSYAGNVVSRNSADEGAREARNQVIPPTSMHLDDEIEMPAMDVRRKR